jgi:CheY-like chemotaxis protein
MARILLIDDDDAVRSVVHRVLDRHGHTVIEARDGEEGLELLPRVVPDLLITDLTMPGKGGLAVLAELREKYPPVKAIAMSGGGRFGAPDGLQVAKSLGAAKVLAKPFSCEALLAAVNELLAGGGASSRDGAR